MKVLVDSSVWIDYFRSGKKTRELDYFIEENVIVVNDFILAELIPSLLVRGYKTVVGRLYSIEKNELNIDWREITDLQFKCLKKGRNGIGIPDLIIGQNAIQNNCILYTLDKHFEYISEVSSLKLIQSKK